MAQIVPKRMLEDIRFNNDIVEVIGSYFTLKHSGAALKALCPFHKEKTPSFTVNAQRQIYHCFGCGAGGDVFNFVMKYEGVDFMGAIKILAQRAGISIELEHGDGETGFDKNLLYKLLSETANLYHKAFMESKNAVIAREYLKGRNLDENIINFFLIGYAPDKWDAVINWALKKKYTAKQLETVGLIIRRPGKDSINNFYDRFRNRLMFPIFDEQGRVIGFSGRSLSDNDKTAKYVNSPETPLFKKSRVLYALGKARRNIVESREAIICEGQIDVIRCHQAGLKTAIASQGTAFTEDHSRIIKRYADSVVIAFDHDKAGQDAALKAAIIFMEAGMAVRIAILPDNEDPDSFICKNGIEEFKSIINNAETIINYQIDILSKRENMKSEPGIMRISRAVLNTIIHSPDSVQRAKLIQDAASRLNLPASSLYEELQTIMRRSRRNYNIHQEKVKVEEETAVPLTIEKALCEHMINVTDNPSIGILVEKYLPMKLISDTRYRTLVKACLESLKTGEDIHIIMRCYDNISHDEYSLAAGIIEESSKKVFIEISQEDAVKDIILRIWQNKLKQERSELENKNPERRSQITYDLQALKTWEEGSVFIEMELECLHITNKKQKKATK